DQQTGHRGRERWPHCRRVGVHEDVVGESLHELHSLWREPGRELAPPLWPRPTSSPLLAASAKPLTKPWRSCGGSCDAAVSALSCRALASWFCSTAPAITALPIALPIWRLVFSVPEAAPLMTGGTSRIASVVRGAMVQPIPRPVTASGSANVNEVDVTDSTRARPASPAPKTTKPSIRM